jgi:hypothetical protein
MLRLKIQKARSSCGLFRFTALRASASKSCTSNYAAIVRDYAQWPALWIRTSKRQSAWMRPRF